MKKKRKNNKLKIVAIIAVAIVLLWFLGVFSPFSKIPSSPFSTSGSLELRMVDAPSIINVSNIFVDVSKVSVHYGGDNESGWISVSEEPVTLDLLTLREGGLEATLGKVNLQPGHYNQIRLYINSSRLIVSASNKTYDANVPSEVIKINRGFDIVKGKKLILLLDFNPEQSFVYSSSLDRFTLRPTIRVIPKNVDCTEDADCPVDALNQTQACVNYACSLGV